MAVAVRQARGEEHPGDLIERAATLCQEADELRAEADRLKERAKEREAQAAALRHKADRIMNPELGVSVKRPPVKAADSLTAAAALAVEDMEGTILATHLAAALGIGTERAGRLLEALREMDRLERLHSGGYVVVDLELRRVRDAAIAMDQFTERALAEQLDMPVESLRWYLLHLKQRGVLESRGEAKWAYCHTGAERVITRRRSGPSVEEEVRRKEGIVVVRGETVPFTGKPMIETSGSQRRAAERRKRGGTTKKQKQRGK
jgi:hypothetical protein